MNRPLALLAAAVAGMTAVAGCSFRGAESLPLPGGPGLGDHPYEVQIDFVNVLDLVPHSVVKVNDVSVGEVTDIKLDGWHARVTCEVRGDVALPDNAVATVSQTSLLGEKFVALSRPVQEAPEGRLAQGDVIPLSRTSRTTEVEEVLSALSALLNGGGIEQISTITHELNAALDGRTDTIRDVLHRVNTFVGTLDRHKDSINRALVSLDRLTAKLAAEKETIAQTLDDAAPAIKILNQNRADLTKMLVSLSKFGDTATRVINASRDDLLANLRALQPILANLNKAGTDLPNGLENLVTFPFPSTSSNALRGDFANLHISLDLDLGVLAHNLLGGTALEGLADQQERMRDLIQPPNITLPQTPPGVLPPGGLPGLTPGAGGGGLPGGGGAPPSAPGGERSPSGTPSDQPSGQPSGRPSGIDGLLPPLSSGPRTGEPATGGYT
ncbi:MAG TPA: MCE family protein [Streptosporangiaceae bacterium]|nr:MCE family protein [Streptosporangiaceae bacterium]